MGESRCWEMLNRQCLSQSRSTEWTSAATEIGVGLYGAPSHLLISEDPLIACDVHHCQAMYTSFMSGRPPSTTSDHEYTEGAL